MTVISKEITMGAANQVTKVATWGVARRASRVDILLNGGAIGDPAANVADPPDADALSNVTAT